MKTRSVFRGTLSGVALTILITATNGAVGPLEAAAVGPACAAPRIGVYDSRVVAYAWFWSEAGFRHRRFLLAEAEAARASGSAERITQANEALSAFQEHNHLQVFSTEPVDELLADIEAALPAILEQAGVTCLVSTWDAEGLHRHPGAEQVDVTDALTAAFLLPTEKQARVIAGIKARPPLPLDRARSLARSGKL
jgi:hypothetical protein